MKMEKVYDDICFMLFLKNLVLLFFGSNFIQYVPKVDLILVHWVKEEEEKHACNLIQENSKKIYNL